MDDQELPTAAELGVSEEEYARILRDLRERGLGGEAVAFAAELSEVTVPVDAASLYETPAADPDAPVRPRRRLWPLAVAVGLVLGMVGFRAGPGEQAPAYKFIHELNGKPVTYSSCKTVQVAVYPANGPTGAVELVKEAIDTMRTATGLDIRFVGAFGGHAPNWNFEAAPIRPDDPIAISWQDGTAIKRITDHVAGLGGSFLIDGRSGVQYLASGTIALSRDVYARLDLDGDHAEQLAILLHEFGHVFGLDHVKSSGELMYEDNIGRTTLGPGDLQGLSLAGRGPCV